MQVLTGDNVLIGGFIITGISPKKVIVRAIGPSLAAFGVRRGAGRSDARFERARWHGHRATTTGKRVSKPRLKRPASSRPTTRSQHCAKPLFPAPTQRSCAGANGATGIGLVEAYDLDQPADSKLANISTRGFIDTGDNVMIGGFIIGPNGLGDATVLVRSDRAIVGKFRPRKALQDPVLELHSGNGDSISTNDDWRDMQ